MSEIIFVRINKCPFCGYLTDGVEAIDGTMTMPEPGSASICIRCGEISQFDKDLKLEKMNSSQIEKWQSTDPEDYLKALKAQAIIKEMASDC